MIEMKNTIITTSDLLEEFLLDCRVRNLSEDTIMYYQKKFGYLCDFIRDNVLKSREQNVNVNLLRKETITQYIIYMQAKKLKTSTININLRAIRAILYYAMDKEYINRFEIKVLKEEIVLKDLFKDKEIEIFIY